MQIFLGDTDSGVPHGHDDVTPIAALPGVRELHIGHAIVSRAVFVGLRQAVATMKALIREAAVVKHE